MKFNVGNFIVGIMVIAAAVLIFFIITKGTNAPDIASSEPANQNINSLSTNTMNSNAETYEFPGVLPDDRITDKQVTIKTAKGNIVLELYPEDAPKTVSNFVYLTDKGFYNGLTFHRVEAGFVIQGGDPSGDGTGGPGYEFEDETVTKSYDEGIVAMANSGADTNGSQFFIMLADNKTLPKDYTIFGKVTSGMDVVKQIAVGDVMETVTVSDK
ncbi:MAG: peptidylprolyl isomerase [Patescibacteria group bacterium]|nr:peptidylprolyl isomerase [Patescibacteria group bacterium]